MSDLFVYLIKVNIALVIFCMGYYLVLRHLTFMHLTGCTWYLPFCLQHYTRLLIFRPCLTVMNK